MKIVIVGAGVSGLSTYLQLLSSLPAILPVEILIYDPHASSNAADSAPVSDSTAVVGNSIILPPSSIRLLEKISPKVCALFKSRGFENHAFTIRSARGHTLGTVPTRDDVAPVEYSISCPRWVLWECLQEVVGREAVVGKKVVRVDWENERGRPFVEYEDGGLEVADLVVGADGAHSVVKKALFGNAFAPQFEGFRGVGTFLNIDSMPQIITAGRSVVVTFGPTGSFGYASAAPVEERKLGWWSNWPTADPPRSNYTAGYEVRKQLQLRHGSWADPVIRTCIAESSTDRVYPLWTTPDLPHWGERGCVLLGDAAHTLQATSGQGAAQALEDSVTFSLLLSHYLSEANLPAQEEEGVSGSSALAQSIEAASVGLYELRHERVENIKAQARNLYLGLRPGCKVWQEYLYYFFLFVVTSFPRLGQWIIGNSFRETHEWDPETHVRKYISQSRAQRAQ